jgi:flagellar protein FliJ
MDRAHILHTLLERDERRRDEALSLLQDCQRLEAQAEQQVQGLITYRAEYHQRWQQQFAQGTSMDILRCYQGFVERLEHAIAAQQAAVEQARTRVGGARNLVRQREIKLATVRRLIERRVQAQALVGQRREQKANDESAQRMGALTRARLAPA